MNILRTLETDGVPAPSDVELEAMDRRTVPITAHTRCNFNCYVRLRNINDERPYFHQFIVDQGRVESVLSLWQWDSLLDLYDDIDEDNTKQDARYAGCP